VIENSSATIIARPMISSDAVHAVGESASVLSWHSLRDQGYCGYFILVCLDILWKVEVGH
jgi:hypothetical protein